MASCLVTGGAGFIGSTLVDALIEQGHDVVVVDNLSTGKRSNVSDKALFVQRDIIESLEDLFVNHRFEYVFHLAAQINLRVSLEKPADDAQTNIVGSVKLAECAARHGVKNFIFSSTGGAIYSPHAPLPCTETSLTEPLSPYGLAKLTVEGYLRILHQTKGLSYVALRYSNVYGPRQNPHGEAGVIAIFIDRALHGKALSIFGDGTQTRDFVYVDDVVAANVRAMSLSGTYNVSSGVETSVTQIAHLIVREVGQVPIVHAQPVVGELKRSVLSSALLQQHGWKPMISFENGLKRTIEHTRKGNL